MLVAEINRGNFEYDVHAILQAFYPEEQVRVLTPETGEEKRTLLEEAVQIRIRLYPESAVIDLDGQEYDWNPAVDETPEPVSDREKVPDLVSDGKGTPEPDAGEDKRYKYGFKCFLYRTLSQVTGRTLPWGSLTGIRPTKIAYGLLEQGKSEEEIIDFYREKYDVSREKAKLSVDIAGRERRILAGIHNGTRNGADGCGSKDSADNGYSLYIGIPFCPTTCLYCSFTSFPAAAYRNKIDTYIDCLIKEMEAVAGIYGDRVLDCVYIGGGTPTTLEAGQLDRLLTKLKGLFDFSTVKEFTVEAGRADSITEEKLRVLYRHGVSRISVNPQTMKQETLDIIGRRASVEQVEEAYALARQVGFDNINMDLILGLPGEGEEDVQRTVDRVVAMAPDSLTVHSLAIKRASQLSKWIQENGVSMLRNTDATMRIAAEGARKLGLAPYYLYRQKNMSGNFENVGYAREGKLGLYNILIMEEVQTIIACGAGSISKRVYPDGRIERCENVKDVSQYIERIGEMIERKRVLLED